MVGYERVHWYLTPKCNLAGPERCKYCFSQEFGGTYSLRRNISIANALGDLGLKEVILGGGEPTLVKNLPEVAEVLSGRGIGVGLHTNGTLLNRKLIEKLKRTVVDVALPIDSANLEVQKRLRGKKFMETYQRIPEMISWLKQEGFRVGLHTVFTNQNAEGIFSLYDVLSSRPFDYWRIYEYNFDLTKKDSAARELADFGTREKAYTDGLLAKFLLADEEFALGVEDERVKFILRENAFPPYVFVDNNGDLSYYARFSIGERRVFANVLKQSSEEVRKGLSDLSAQDIGFDDFGEDDFLERKGGAPFWTAGHLVGIFPEEYEGIDSLFLHFARKLNILYARKTEGLKINENDLNF